MATQRCCSSAVRPLDPRERVVSIDVLRGIALFGVMAVNIVTEFRVSIFEQFLPHDGTAPSLDKIANTFVELALASKALCLFSFLFGVSLAILFDRLSHSGRPLYWISRRLAVLLAFGVVHLLFIWNGDILTAYAIAGLLLLPLLGTSTSVVAVAAAVLLLIFTAVPFPPPPLSWPTAASLQAHVSEANRVYATGGLIAVWHFSLRELPLILLLHAFVFPRTLALFLLGVLTWRVRLFEGTLRARQWLAWIAIVGCSAGGALSVADWAGVRLTTEALGPFREALPRLAPVMLALGYGAAVIAFVQSRHSRTVLTSFAPVGRMAFSNYVLQSLVFGFVFFGVGLGYFGQLGAFAALMFGSAVFATQCWLSAWWLRRYCFGPLEWLWRTLMYGRTQEMKFER
jgi:uncharacterized protein